MAFKRIKLGEFNPYTESEKTVKVQPGQYLGIFFRYSGIMAGGTIVAQTNDNLGSCWLTRNGREIARVKTWVLNRLLANDLGITTYQNTVSTASTRFECSAFLPFFIRGTKNVLDIQSPDEALFTIKNSMLFTADSAGTGIAHDVAANPPKCEVYGWVNEFEWERYEPIVKQENIDRVASSEKGLDLSGANFARLLFREGVSTSPATDASQCIQNIRLKIDNAIVMDESYFNAISAARILLGNLGTSRAYTISAATVTDGTSEGTYASRLIDFNLVQASGDILAGANFNARAEVTYNATSVTGYTEVTEFLWTPNSNEAQSRQRAEFRRQAYLSKIARLYGADIRNLRTNRGAANQPAARSDLM